MCVILLLLKLLLKQLNFIKTSITLQWRKKFWPLLYYYSSLWVIYFSGLIHTRTKLFPWKTTKLYRPLKVHCALWLIKRKSTWINQVIDLLKLKDDFWRIYPLERLSAGKTIGGTNDRREVCGPWQLFPAYCNNNNALLVVNVHSTTIYCGT